MHAGSTVTFLFDLDPISLDLLVEGRKRNMETVCRFGLTPTTAFEHLNNDPLLNGVHDVEQ